MVAVVKGQVTSLEPDGFAIRTDDGADVRVRTLTPGTLLALAVGERVSVSGEPDPGGVFWARSIHTLDAQGRWDREVPDQPRPPNPAPPLKGKGPNTKVIAAVAAGVAVLAIGLGVSMRGGDFQAANAVSADGRSGPTPYAFTENRQGPAGWQSGPAGPTGPAAPWGPGAGPGPPQPGSSAPPYPPSPPDAPGYGPGAPGYGPAPSYGPGPGPAYGPAPGSSGPGVQSALGGEAPPGMQLVRSPAGMVARTTLNGSGSASKLAEGLAAMLEGYFGGPLQVIGRQTDPADQFAQVAFNATKGGAPVSGFLVVQVKGPQGGLGYLMFDHTQRIQSSMQAMYQAASMDSQGRS